MAERAEFPNKSPLTASKGGHIHRAGSSEFASVSRQDISAWLTIGLIALLTTGFLPQALAKGPATAAKAAPRQVIYSLSQQQQNSEVMKVWGVPACVLMGAERPRGLYITGFTGEGLGNELGLEVGDVVLSLNGHVLMDARQADTVLRRMKSGQLKAVVARAANVPGGITLLSPKVLYTANPFNQGNQGDQTYVAEGGNHSFSSGGMSDNSSEPSVSALEDFMFSLVNGDRRANGGLPPLSRSGQLGALARKYAEDMRKRNFFGHDDPDGLGPKDRARRDGITVSVWENLAMESGSHGHKNLVLRGEQQMMNEPPNVPTNHRGCILSEHHHCVGIGVAVAPTKVFCVQEFSPADLP